MSMSVCFQVLAKAASRLTYGRHQSRFSRVGMAVVVDEPVERLAPEVCLGIGSQFQPAGVAAPVCGRVQPVEFIGHRRCSPRNMIAGWITHYPAGRHGWDCTLQRARLDISITQTPRHMLTTDIDARGDVGAFKIFVAANPSRPPFRRPRRLACRRASGSAYSGALAVATRESPCFTQSSVTIPKR